MTQSPTGLRSRQSLPEFISLIAFLISIVALTIDAMLPALPAIGQELSVARANDTQLVISLFFLGFAVGQLIYGPMSDSLGRKTMVFAGLVLFVLGCILSLLATDFTTMLIGRVLQGLGAAGPRTVTIAIVRDRYAGREMARIMSFVMAVFIIVPAVAPTLGQVILELADWRAIFFFLIALALLVFFWMQIRLPESLPIENRTPLSLRRIWYAAAETFSNRIAFGYTLSAGFIFGAFVVYLSTAQQVFHDVFNLSAHQFPLFFAILALFIGAASITNAKLVMRFGMRVLSFYAIFILTGLSLAYTGYIGLQDAAPSLWSFMAWGAISFFCMGILFGNLNALAMEPLGHIAGTASAVIGAVSTFMSLIFGITIGQIYDGTIIPLIAGFAVLGCVSIITMLITNRGLRGGNPA